MTATATTTPIAGATATAAGGRRAHRGGGAPSAWPRTLVAVQSQGATLSLLAARQDAAGTAPGVIDTASIPAGDSAAIQSFLSRHKPAEIVRLIPSASTVARCVPTPPGLVAERENAPAVLALLAESELPSLIPAHRRAAGFIRPGVDSTGEAVLAVGWPPRKEPAPQVLPVKEEAWTPELVALAALARALGGVQLALYADRASGSVAIIASGKHHAPGTMNGASNGAHARTVARVLRGDTSSDNAWLASLERAAAETASSIGLPHAPLDIPPASPTALVILGSPMRRPRGMPADPAWLSNYGLACGAVFALADADAAARPLASLRADAPREAASPIVGAVTWLSVPRHAALIAAICVAVFLFLPLGAAKVREVILAARAGGTQKLNDRIKDAERRVAFYQQLRDKRWPMTKLVADIAGAAPVGVHIDTLTISREQGLTIHGKADTEEHVTTFRSNLFSSGVFGSLTTPNIETESGAVTFQLEAQVVAPQFNGKREGDFVKDPLAVRLYGERARAAEQATTGEGADATTGAAPMPGSTASSAPASEPSREPDAAPRAARSSRGSLRGEPPAHNEAAPSSGSRRSATANAIPEPLTDEQIAKMDRTTAMLEFSGRKSAAAKVDDPVIKQRLLDESAKCQARMKAAGS